MNYDEFYKMVTCRLAPDPSDDAAEVLAMLEGYQTGRLERLDLLVGLADPDTEPTTDLSGYRLVHSEDIKPGQDKPVSRSLAKLVRSPVLPLARLKVEVRRYMKALEADQNNGYQLNIYYQKGI